MSIDARIRQVRRCGKDVLIRLQPRVVESKYLSLPGQRRLLILNCENPPVKNQIIWGGSNRCIIEPGFGVEETRHFERVGSTRLVELEEAQNRRAKKAGKK